MSVSGRLRQRLRKDRPMTKISLRMPEDVLEELKEIAPKLGFSGYQPLIRAYIGQGLRRFHFDQRECTHDIVYIGARVDEVGIWFGNEKTGRSSLYKGPVPKKVGLLGLDDWKGKDNKKVLKIQVCRRCGVAINLRLDKLEDLPGLEKP